MPEALGEQAKDGILKAVGFELMWLKNKRNFYGLIYEEDKTRIELLEGRYKKLIEEAGGKYEQEAYAFKKGISAICSLGK